MTSISAHCEAVLDLTLYDLLSVTCGRCVVLPGYSIQNNIIKFTIDLRKVCGFVWELYATLYDKVCLQLAAD